MEAQYQYLVELTRHNILLHLKRNHCWDHCSPSTLQLYIKQYYDLIWFCKSTKNIPYDHYLLISQKSTVNRLSRISLSELDIKVSGRRGAVEISVSSRFRCPYGSFRGPYIWWRWRGDRNIWWQKGLVTQTCGDRKVWWHRHVVTERVGDKDMWWQKGLVTKTCGDRKGWWQRHMVTETDGDRWDIRWQRQMVTETSGDRKGGWHLYFVVEIRNDCYICWLKKKLMFNFSTQRVVIQVNIPLMGGFLCGEMLLQTLIHLYVIFR